MGRSESHTLYIVDISMIQYMTFTSPHKQILIEIEIFTDFSLAVHGEKIEKERLPGI